MNVAWKPTYGVYVCVCVIEAGFHIHTGVQWSLKCLSRSRRRLQRRSPRESTQKQTANRRREMKKENTHMHKNKVDKVEQMVAIKDAPLPISILLYRLQVCLPVSLRWVLTPVTSQKAKLNKWHCLIFSLRHKSVQPFYEPVLSFIPILYWHQAHSQQMPVIYSLPSTSAWCIGQWLIFSCQ